ncbi:MAG: transcriptional regulator, GntR family [Ramlibacter sp.]|nr:transcriptional regulator, GntR family [Ramlibacter sp.]
MSSAVRRAPAKRARATPLAAPNETDSESLSERAERELRRRLLVGEYVSGQRLSLAEIAQQLGMSVTPVREAVFKLVGVHALLFKPGYYASVPAMTPARYREVAQIRKSLESLAARTAMPLMGPEEFEQLDALFASFKKAKESGRVREALEFNYRFRFAIYERARMPVLVQVIEDFWLQTGPLFNLLFPMLTGTHQYERPYGALLRALRQRNVDKVHEAVEAAIDAGSERILPLMDTLSGR